MSCRSYGTPGDIIDSVEVTSDDPDDYTPGPVANILSYYDNENFWCGHREEILPINATFHFTEEVLLTSVAFHGFDGPLGDDYITQYSWEYSVGNSTVKTYTDLGNNTVSHVTCRPYVLLVIVCRSLRTPEKINSSRHFGPPFMFKH